MDAVNIMIDKNTYNKLMEIAVKKGVPLVDEISFMMRKHIEIEKDKLHESNNGKQLLCEG